MSKPSFKGRKAMYSFRITSQFPLSQENVVTHDGKEQINLIPDVLSQKTNY